MPDYQTKTLPYAVVMMAHCLRRWPNIKTTLGERVLFTGSCLGSLSPWIRGPSMYLRRLNPDWYYPRAGRPRQCSIFNQNAISGN